MSDLVTVLKENIGVSDEELHLVRDAITRAQKSRSARSHGSEGVLEYALSKLSQELQGKVCEAMQHERSVNGMMQASEELEAERATERREREAENQRRAKAASLGGARPLELKYEVRSETHMRVHQMLAEHRFTVAVCHRRYGKTILAINTLITAALATPGGKFFYAAPTLKMAKKIAWGALKEYCDGIPQMEFLVSELVVRFPNGSEITLFSGEDHDAMRGNGFHGGVMDEVGDFPYSSWGGSIRPTLSDHQGWCLFIGTPKGIDLFHELYQRGLDPDFEEWASILLPATETGVIPDAELESARRDATTPAQFEREFLCSFEASTDDVLIPLPPVLQAMKRKAGIMGTAAMRAAPMIIGVDVARQGADQTVLLLRNGDAVLEIEKIDNPDIMFALGRLQQLIRKHTDKSRNMGIDAIFVDGTGGYGAGLVDHLRSLGRDDVYDINFGSSALDNERFANRRAEMWGRMADWLKKGHAMLPDDKVLLRDLTAVRYKYDASNRLQLERKDELKKRLGASPDIADALALTFAMDVERKTHDPYQRRLEEHVLRREMLSNSYGGGDYDPFA